MAVVVARAVLAGFEYRVIVCVVNIRVLALTTGNLTLGIAKIIFGHLSLLFCRPNLVDIDMLLSR